MKIQTYSSPAGFKFGFLALSVFSSRKQLGLNPLIACGEKKKKHTTDKHVQHNRQHDFQQWAWMPFPVSISSLGSREILNEIPGLKSKHIAWFFWGCFFFKLLAPLYTFGLLWFYIGFITIINTKRCNFTLRRERKFMVCYQHVITTCQLFYFIDSRISHHSLIWIQTGCLHTMDLMLTCKDFDNALCWDATHTMTEKTL